MKTKTILKKYGPHNVENVYGLDFFSPYLTEEPEDYINGDNQPNGYNKIRNLTVKISSAVAALQCPPPWDFGVADYNGCR